MRKLPKLVKSTWSSKETGLNEDEVETIIGLEKNIKSIEDINCTINELLQNPSFNACPFNDFKDLHNLLHEGINPHRLRISKDILEIEMI
jgi:hypothetical protein